jgi:hypothetical protein
MGGRGLIHHLIREWRKHSRIERRGYSESGILNKNVRLIGWRLAERPVIGMGIGMGLRSAGARASVYEREGRNGDL